MSSKAGLRAQMRIGAAGKLRQIRSTVKSDVSLLQNAPDQFIAAQFCKVANMASKLNQQHALRKMCEDYLDDPNKKQENDSSETPTQA